MSLYEQNLSKVAHFITSGGVVDLGAFEAEIKSDKTLNNGVGFLTVLDGSYTESSGDTVTLYWRSEPPQEELDQVIVLANAHSGLGVEEIIPVAVEPHPTVGMLVVQPLAIRPSAQDKHKSWQATAGPEQIANADILIDEKLTGPNGLCLLAGGRFKCRTNAEHGSALHLAVVDRDNVTGMFPFIPPVMGGPLQLTKLTLTNKIGGDVEVGNFAVGMTSGARSKVLNVVDADNIEITFDSGWDSSGYPVGWIDGEDVQFQDALGQSTGVTAEFVDWIEGGIIEIQRPVEDEWVEGFEEGIIEPGGASEIPIGMYLRMILYNAHTRDSLRIKVSLKLGLE